MYFFQEKTKLKRKILFYSKFHIAKNPYFNILFEGSLFGNSVLVYVLGPSWTLRPILT